MIPRRESASKRCGWPVSFPAASPWRWPIDVLKSDTDYYLDYTFNETLRQLQKADVFLPTDPKALARAVDRLSDSQLKAAPDLEPVLVARLERKGMDLNTRSGALEQLSDLHKSNRVREAIASLRRLDATGASPAAFSDLGTLLAANPVGDLVAAQDTLKSLASGAKEIPVRRAAMAALVVAAGQARCALAANRRTPRRQDRVDRFHHFADRSGIPRHF